MFPKNGEIEFKNYKDLVYGVFELRKKGLAFISDTKNEEYVIVSRYNQLSLLNSDKLFDFQFSSHNLMLGYENLKIS